MNWEDALFVAVMAALDAERVAMRGIAGPGVPPDERLGLHWLPELAFGHTVWKGLVACFGVDRVHKEVAATAFDRQTAGDCDFVVELPNDEVLWLELKYIQRVWPVNASGWNDWRSWTGNPYFDSIASDLWRWSQPPSRVRDMSLGCAHHGLMLATFWGTERADRPQAPGELIPEGNRIARHLRDRGGPGLTTFGVRSAQRDDCRRVASRAPNTGNDVFLQMDLLLRAVSQGATQP